LLLLDEPLEGLAPILVEDLLRGLKRIIREESLSAIVVEQHARRILDVTDDAIILNRGAIVHASSSRALVDDPTPLEQHLGVTAKKKPGHSAVH
jgi:branched-chain amino acid transport system ATP-binding protein